MTALCSHCGAGLKARQRFCPHCGKESDASAGDLPEPATLRCPGCDAVYDASRRFCKIDGAELVSGGRSRAGQWSAPDVRQWLSRVSPDDATITRWQAWIMAFITLHGILLCLTLGWLILVLVAGSVSAIFALPLLAAWIVALSRSESLLRTVGGMDERFLGAYEKARHGGKFRRWVLRPLYWITDNWNAYSSRVTDQHAFAALRLFGYITLIMVVIAVILALAYAALVIAITIALLVLGFYILGAVLDVDTPRRGGKGRVFGGMDPLMGGGARGRDIRRGRGGFFGSDEKAGRIDADGNIYDGRGGLFGSEEKIGRIDAEGNIYEGKGGLFSSEQKIGRRDEDGNIFEGEGGLFGSEEKIGRRDTDGAIYRGKGGWFGHEEKIGRHNK